MIQTVLKLEVLILLVKILNPLPYLTGNKDSLNNDAVVYMGNDGFNLGNSDTYIKADYIAKTIAVRGLDSEGSFSDRQLKKRHRTTT